MIRWWKRRVLRRLEVQLADVSARLDVMQRVFLTGEKVPFALIAKYIYLRGRHGKLEKQIELEKADLENK
jgi:hypothetical protein